MSSPLTPNRVVPLDQLQPDALALETALDGRFSPGAGWFLLTATAVDMLGNLLGVPVLSGTALAAAEAVPGPGLTATVLAVQLAALVGGLALLARSPWRAWKVEIAEELAGEPSDPTARSFGPVALALFGLMLAGTAVVVGLAWPPALPAVIPAAVAPFAAPAARVVRAVARRVRGDTSSLTGFLAGAALAVAVAAFVAGELGYLGPFLRACWVDGKLSYFRTAELFALSVVLTWGVALPGTRLNADLTVHVGVPADRAKAHHDLRAFRGFRAGRVTAHLLLDQLLEVVVLARRDDGSFDVLDPGRPLELSRVSYVVLYLPAVANWQLRRPDGSAPVKDDKDYFDVAARLTAVPRAFPADVFVRSVTLRPGEADACLGLLRAGDRTDELAGLAQTAVDEYLAEIPLRRRWARLNVGLERVLGEVENVRLRVQPGLTVSGSLTAPTEVDVRAELVEHVNQNTALMEIARLRVATDDLVESYLAGEDLQVGGRAKTAGRFEGLVRQRYGVPPGRPDLLACLGLSVAVDYVPKEGGTRARTLMQSFNATSGRVQNDVLRAVHDHRVVVVDVLKNRLAPHDAARQAALTGMIGALPEVLPWFRNRPQLLLGFLEFAFGRVGGLVRPGDLRGLLEAFVAGPLAGGAEEPAGPRPWRPGRADPPVASGH